MKVVETRFDGLFIIEPTVYGDERGYFMETFKPVDFANLTGTSPIFVQENESMSHMFTVRGLHYQKGKHSQAKLVRVVTGKVIDAVVDLRPDSKTYGESFSVLLSGENKKQLYVPRGFAHGFAVLTNNTIFNYKCDNYYNPESEAGLNPFDPDLKIKWLVHESDALLSEKDGLWPNICDI
jgi:dTDP-4-dehydrorhamnose 3,5-epimerase